MRIAEYKQIDTKIVEKIIHHEGKPIETVNGDTVGVEPSWDETVTEEVPIMGLVYRDMTEEEEAEYNQSVIDLPPIEPTFEDRLEAQVMFTAVMTDTLLEE